MVSMKVSLMIWLYVDNYIKCSSSICIEKGVLIYHDSQYAVHTIISFAHDDTTCLIGITSCTYMLVPPENFGLAEPGIFRCTKLESKNFPFLETLRLKSIVVLDAEKPPRLLKDFLENNQVEFYNIGGLKISNHIHTGANSSSNRDDNETDENEQNIKTADDIETVNLQNSKRSKNDLWMLIEKNLILKAFDILFDKTKHNVLIVDSTSTLIGILRKVQKWNFNSIVNEYRIFSSNANKHNYFAETFLELVQIELIPFEIDELNKSHRKRQSHSEETERKQNTSKDKASPEYIYPSLDPNAQRLSKTTSNTSAYRPQRSDPGSERILADENPVDDDFDEEDMDDDLLSASPQIPDNLLKLVEMRKNNNSNSNRHENKSLPSSSPSASNLRKNSLNNDMLMKVKRGRRRSSLDSKLSRSQNSSGNLSNSCGHICLDSGQTLNNRQDVDCDNLRRHNYSEEQIRLNGGNEKLKRIATAEEENMLRQKFDFKFYKNLNQFPISFEDVSVIKVILPEDSKLPEWFTRNRNSWESNFNALN